MRNSPDSVDPRCNALAALEYNLHFRVKKKEKRKNQSKTYNTEDSPVVTV